MIICRILWWRWKFRAFLAMTEVWSGEAHAEQCQQRILGLRYTRAFMSTGVRERYEEKVRAGEIEPDPVQRSLADRLDGLAGALESWTPPGKGWFARFNRRPEPAPHGLYVHGGVGRGKTMLMDLFFETVQFTPKRRSHFHEFMAEVHERIAHARQIHSGDPIPLVATEMAGSPGLLCFDELHVTDIADAMILGRFFKVVFQQHVVVVATSNAMPNELYQNGLNRQLFLPFIDLLEERMDVVELESAKDFRLEKMAGQPLYFTPNDEAARASMDQHWERLTGHQQPERAILDVKGRQVVVPAAAPQVGVARFEFSDLCEKPLGSNDYLAIAHTFHTVMIDDIPVMGPARRDHARRFINLIDTFYDSGVCIVVSAAAQPDDLYHKGDGANLFTRTASRLVEMRSVEYVAHRTDQANIARETL